MLTITSIIAAVGLAGAALLWVGVRGRRVGDHPFCRRCGFDLFGRAADSRACPECGADVERPRATVVGVRQRRRRPLVAGAVLVVPAVTAGVLVGSGSLRGFDWQQHKPNWYLVREADGPDAARRDAALRELLTRLTAQQLPRDRVDQLTARALELQADAARRWVGAWGDIIEWARANNQLSDERRLKYAEQAASGAATLKVRERVRRGDPVMHELRTHALRLGSAPWQGVIRIAGISLDDHEVLLDRRLDLGVQTLQGPLPGIEQLLPVLGDGVHNGFMCVDVSLVPPGRAPPARAPLRPPNTIRTIEDLTAWHDAQRVAREDALIAAAVTTVRLRLPIEFVLAGADEPPLKPIEDERFRAAVERSVRVTGVGVGRGRSISVDVVLDAPPVDLSFLVGVRDGARYWPLAAIACPAGEKRSFRLGPETFSDGVEGTTVDVLLRPDAGPGVRTIDVLSYWHREVVVKDVPVESVRDPSPAEMAALRERVRGTAGPAAAPPVGRRSPGLPPPAAPAPGR